MVPGSTLMYGSSLMLVTRMPRDSRIAAREAAAIPFPRLETTPPVTNTYLVMYAEQGVKAGVYRNRLSSTNCKLYNATLNSQPVLARTCSSVTPGCISFSARPIDGTTSNTQRSVMIMLTTPLPVIGSLQALRIFGL